jgi:poly(3-hydroxybutyrate) depolymerase
MLRCILAGTIVFAVCSVNAQTINLRGKISNGSGAAVSGAVVTLVGQNLKDTTGSDGMYEIKREEVAVQRMLQPESRNFIVDKGSLVFSLPDATPIKIELFDVKGNLLKRVVSPDLATGFYRFDIAEHIRAAKVVIVHVELGNDSKTFRYLPLHNGKYAINELTSATGGIETGRLMKIAAIDDTLKITAKNFKDKVMAITSYEMEQNITLVSTDEKNAPVPSAGCGKAIGSNIKSGKNTMSSAGGNRTYIVDIPKDYDVNKPYRLIFGMHCMGGDADKVAGTTDQSAQYYHVKTQSDKENIQCIYVAPQGDAGGTWNPSRDLQFFFDLQKLLKDNMCVDTSRVFSVGFSFGAMYTYALSLKYPNILRAVACNAPANWHFDPQPTNNHIPIPYYQTTGISDGTCNWIFSEANKQGGKYCLLQHAEDNGCEIPSEIDLASRNGTHVVTEFKGCDEGYPVKFSSHNGDHWCNLKDPGSNVDWFPVEAWEFFKRF